jgi:hypothetical protein
MDHKPDTTQAATEVDEFISDLDGGVFERKLSVALSQVAAAAMDHDTEGKVTLELTFERIKGTHQVACKHKLKFVKPTSAGKTSEEETRETVMYVGRFGKLSLAQPALLGKQGELIA